MATSTNTNGDCLVEVGEADDSPAERKCQLRNNGQFYLSPHSTAMRVWECLVVISVAITFSLEMFLAAFDSQLVVLWVIAYLFDFIYVLEIVRHFFLGYMDNGILITDRRKIRKHYLLTTFIVDLFTVLPLDLLVFISPGIVAGHMKRLAQYRCINRLLRVHRILSFFNSRESELGTNTSLIRTLKYTTLAAMMNHLLSCAWYALTCVGLHNGLEPVCYNTSWGTSPEINLGTELANTSTGDAYVITLYWAVATTTSTGYGDIHSINENERWFSIFGMLLGIFVFFGMILGGMASMLTNFDGQRARYTHRLNVVKHHLKDHTVPEELQKLVIGYYEYLWVRKKGVHGEGMFESLPITFQAEVSLIANKYILDKAPMFKSMNEGFLRMLSLVIKPSLYLPNQTIANRGEIGHSMYFVHRGEVEVLSEDDDESAIANLKSGKLFGEVSLIFSMPRTHAIRAGAHCDLMVLDKTDLHKVLIHYPDVAKTLQEIAENRCDTAGHLNERVQAGEGVIPASKSLKRPTVAAAMPPRTLPKPSSQDPRRKSLVTASPKREVRAATRVAVTKSIDVFEMEEPGGEWIAVHKGNCCTRLRKRLSDLADKIQNGVIEPNSHFYKVWEKLVLIVTLLVSFIYSYMASFTVNSIPMSVPNSAEQNRTFLMSPNESTNSSDISNPNQHTSGYGDSAGATALLVISYCLDLVLLADIFVKLRTAVATPNGNLNDFASIRKHYCRSFGFILDIIAILPLEMLCFVKPQGHQRWHLFSFLRLNRMTKYWVVPNFFSKLEDDLDVDIGTIRFFKFFIYISLLSHWHACIWYLAACHTDTCYNGLNGESGQAFVFTSKGSRNTDPDSNPQLCDDSNNCTVGSWADHANIRPDTDPFKEYILAMYWAAATMSSTGYGDISAHTTVGRAIALVAMLIGLLLYGYCLSSIAATLANADAPRVTFQEKLFAVQEFMRDHGLGSELQQRVVNYLSLLFRRHRGEAMPGGRRLMHDMPIALQQDIAFDDAQATLGNVPLFKDCDPSFIRMLSLKTHTYLFTPGDIIVYRGDMGREMYFIRRGTCEVLSPDMSRVNSIIGPGQYFGEVGLIFGDYRTATVRASSYCELMMLQRSDLDEVLQNFPLIAKQFKEAAENKQHLMELRNASKKNTEDDSKPKNESERSCQELLLPPNSKPVEMSVKVFDSTCDDYKGPFKSLSPITYVLSFLLMKRCFLPSGKWFQKWEIVRVGVAIIMVFTVSLQAAFLHMNIPLWVINYALDIICYIDMYLKFHTAFYNENNVLVTHPLSTAKHYVKTNFLFDLMACFPTELIAFAIFGSFSGYAVHVYAVVRLNRLLGVYRLPLAFNYLESGVEHETGFIREVKFLFYLLMFIHLLACLWFVNACPPIFDTNPTDDTLSGRIQTNYHMCLNTSWAFKYTDFNTTAQSIAGQYIVSLYWASATCASVGYGDIHAFNVGEMVIALMSMIVGIVFFGYIIASVAASLANADAQRARYQEKLTAVKRFMKDQDMDYELRHRVVNFYDYLWLRTKGVDPDSLFDGLPLSLKADVTLSLYQEIINKVPLFQNTEIGFQKMLSMCIKPILFLAKEYVVKKHDIGSEMFFIHRGVVEVVSEDGNIVFDTMQAGRFFGEISLVFSVPRTASIRAQNNCDLFVLTKEDLDRVLTHYPLIKDQIQKVAEERISAVRKRSKQKANVAPAKPSSSATKQDKIDEKDESKKDEAKPEPQKDESKKDEPKKNQNGQPSLPGAPGPSTTEDNQIEQLALDLSSEETPRPRGCCTKFCSRERFRSCLAAIKKSNRFVLDPSSRFVRYLKYLTCLLGLFTSWTIIYEAAFQHHHIGILVFSYLCEGIFWFEIYIKFHVSYSDKYAELEKDFVKVYNHYFRQTNGFLVDLIAALPIDVFAVFARTEETRLMVLSLLRLIHLLRLIRVSNFFTSWEKELNINVLFVRLSKFFVELFMLIHLFASIWYVIACPLGNCMEGTWADHANTANMGTLRQYCDCIYWCVATMTSTGYGDIHAYTIGEMVFASFVMIVGQLIFGFILGNIASTLANEESNRVAYEEHLTAIKDHMKDQSLPSKLQKRVVSYYDYIWMRNKGVNEKELFKDAPSCMHAEIWLGQCEHLLKKVPLFRGAEESFFRTLSPIMRRILFMPQDFIVRQGDVGDEMYFIHRGTVSRMSDKDETKIAKILDFGDYFDDINLVYDVPRSCSYQAVSHVDVYALSRDDLQSVLRHYPIVEAQIKDIASEMYGEASSSYAENNGVYLG